MAQEQRKRFFGEEPQPLPNIAYVTLTEAVTWIVTSDCRSDDYLAEKNFALWGNTAGPQWLLRHLELLKKGETWRFQPDVIEAKVRLTLRDFEEAKRWFEVQGCDAETSYNRVEEALRETSSLAARFDECHQLIYESAATQEIELVGFRRDYDTGQLADDFEPIKFTFFLRPLRNSMGDGWHSRSELSSPSYPFNRMLGDILGRVDARPVYERVMIRRDDARKLKMRFAEGQEGSADWKIGEGNGQYPSKRGFSQVRVNRWYKEERVGKFDPTSGGTSEADDLKAARQKFGNGVTREAIRKARRNHAPGEWKRPGMRSDSRGI